MSVLECRAQHIGKEIQHVDIDHQTYYSSNTAVIPETVNSVSYVQPTQLVMYNPLS